MIVVYSGSMPEWGDLLCQILEEDPGVTGTPINVQDKDLLSMVLFLPRTSCVILAPMASAALIGLDPMVNGFYEQGGAVIGFSPSTDIRYDPEMASEVIPFFSNNSSPPERTGESPGNTYVRDDVVPEVNGELPGPFKLIGTGFLLSSTATGDALEVLPPSGARVVFFRESRTGAPLVMGYSREGTGRSVGFAGCRINDIPRSNSYFGHLGDQEEFVSLFQGAVAWAIAGSSREPGLEKEWEGLLGQEKNRRVDAAARGEEMRRRAETTRFLTILGAWLGSGVACCLVTWKLILPGASG
jgi:hypothetical protein